MMNKKILIAAILLLGAAMAFAAIPAYDFTAYDAEGNAHTLSEYFGKPIVLNFWASWCSPCKAELPDFMAAAKTNKDISFIFLNVTDNIKETLSSAKAFLAKQGYSNGIYLFDTKLNGTMTYGVTGYPTTYFIDKAGQLVAMAQGSINAATLNKGIDMIR
jgi:thiol-disulfide isomerase/thioredoxin